jgi:hypothetical protein
MYTITIENVEKSNGNPYASVLFSRDTGKMEMYRELVLVTPATPEVLATNDFPAVPAADAVYDYQERTRPKIEEVRENFYFSTQEELDTKIISKHNELIAKQQIASSTVIGAFVPPTPVLPTPEELAAQASAIAKMEWLRKKAALATMVDDMDRAAKIGKTPSVDQIAIMTGLANWIDANMKQEYYF